MPADLCSKVHMANFQRIRNVGIRFPDGILLPPVSNQTVSNIFHHRRRHSLFENSVCIVVAVSSSLLCKHEISYPGISQRKRSRNSSHLQPVNVLSISTSLVFVSRNSTYLFRTSPFSSNLVWVRILLNRLSTGIGQNTRILASFSARSWPSCLSSAHGPVPITRSNRRLVSTKHAWSVISRYLLICCRTSGGRTKRLGRWLGCAAIFSDGFMSIFSDGFMSIFPDGFMSVIDTMTLMSIWYGGCS